MIDATELSVVRPSEVEAGTLLLRGAHYDEAPMFVFSSEGQLGVFDLAGAHAFKCQQMVTNFSPYIAAGACKILVDPESCVSLNRAGAPVGSVVIIGSEPAFATSMGYGRAFVSLSGLHLEDPRSYDRMVAFNRWQALVPAFGEDEWYAVHEADVEAQPR